MSFWILFWKGFFVVTLLAFAVMSVWVTIGGFADIKKLFRKMEEENQRLAEGEDV